MLLNKAALFFHVATLCYSRLQHNIAPFEYTQLKKEILWIKLLALCTTQRSLVNLKG